VSSSNLLRFNWNLYTGEKKYAESRGVIADKAVHASKVYPAGLKITCPALLETES